jgi:phosphoribosylaminoimidazole-succinocarboxamide synthase
MGNNVVLQTDFPGLKLLGRGKVRDIYEVDGKLLLVTTDRLSAFDVVLPEGIPGKGEVLNRISAFWFGQIRDVVSNHMISIDPADYPEETRPYADILEGRSMLCRKATPLMAECIVRGYISGSGWSDYKKTGKICGIELPAGLVESDKLPEPIFTPSNKAATGKHDENISFEQMGGIDGIGVEIAEEVRKTAIALYSTAAEYALKRGIIIADTKFEFGIDENGQLILIDEALTPDSSRFWPAESYKPGGPQPSFDKQFVRDYLLELGWDKTPPGPILPPGVIERTSQKYREALLLLAS